MSADMIPKNTCVNTFWLDIMHALLKTLTYFLFSLKYVPVISFVNQSCSYISGVFFFRTKERGKKSF